MNKIVAFLLTLSLNVPLYAAEAAPDLPQLDAKAMFAQIRPQDTPQPQPPMPPELQQAVKAVASLRKALEARGAKGEVRAFSQAGGAYALGVDFPEYNDYQLAQTLFTAGPDGMPTYMKLKVYIVIGRAADKSLAAGTDNKAADTKPQAKGDLSLIQSYTSPGQYPTAAEAEAALRQAEQGLWQAGAQVVNSWVAPGQDSGYVFAVSLRSDRRLVISPNSYTGSMHRVIRFMTEEIGLLEGQGHTVVISEIFPRNGAHSYSIAYLAKYGADRSAGKDTREDLNWKHIALQATDSTKISVNYAAASLGGTIIAEPFWLTVSNPSLKGGEKVRAVVVTIYEATAGSKEAVKEMREVELEYTGQAFQAKAPRVYIREGHHSWVHNFRQEIAVVIDGRWLTDPVNGTHNFRIKLDPVVNPWNKSAAEDKNLKFCWYKAAEKDVCIYKCWDGSTYTQPMQRPDPFEDYPVIPCPQLVFPF